MGLILMTCVVIWGFYPVVGQVTSAVSSTLKDLHSESVLDLKLIDEGTEAEAAVACREGGNS